MRKDNFLNEYTRHFVTSRDDYLWPQQTCRAHRSRKSTDLISFNRARVSALWSLLSRTQNPMTSIGLIYCLSENPDRAIKPRYAHAHTHLCWMCFFVCVCVLCNDTITYGSHGWVGFPDTRRWRHQDIRRSSACICVCWLYNVLIHPQSVRTFSNLAQCADHCQHTSTLQPLHNCAVASVRVCFCMIYVCVCIASATGISVARVVACAERARSRNTRRKCRPGTYARRSCYTHMKRRHCLCVCVFAYSVRVQRFES